MPAPVVFGIALCLAVIAVYWIERRLDAWLKDSSERGDATAAPKEDQKTDSQPARTIEIAQPANNDGCFDLIGGCFSFLFGVVFVIAAALAFLVFVIWLIKRIWFMV